jgi:hypothetical protein
MPGVKRSNFIFQAILFSFYGILLGALTIFCIVQGVLIQANGLGSNAIIYYAAGLLAAVGVTWNFVQARSKLSTAEILSWK